MKRQSEKYDIFISYRRENGYDTAKHLNDLLVRDGYRVSFDIDTLRNGAFDTQLLQRIEDCIDFILIVDAHAFDRTLDPLFDPQNDWLRCELAHAIKHNKNIIPVFLSGSCTFPDGLPEDIAAVVKENGPEYNRYYFNDFYKRLRTKFLKSRSRRRSMLYLLCTTIVVLVLTALIIVSKVLAAPIYQNPINPHTTTKEEFLSYVVKELKTSGLLVKGREDMKTVWEDKSYRDSCEAQFYLGCIYYCEFMYKEAFKAFERSALKGYAPAEYALGVCYDNAISVRQNYNKAVTYYELSANQNYAPAQNDFGVICLINSNSREALSLFEKSAEQNYAPAQYNLAYCYASSDIEECIYWLKKSAKNGYRIAEYNRAVMYITGPENYRNLERGVILLEELAEKGCDLALTDLATCYSIGCGVEKDMEKAWDLMLQAANKGNVNAKTSIGMAYISPPLGCPIEQDYQLAFSYLSEAAEEGYPIAQYALGEMYKFGYGVKKNMLKKRIWCSRAVDQGFSLQQYQQYSQQLMQLAN